MSTPPDTASFAPLFNTYFTAFLAIARDLGTIQPSPGAASRNRFAWGMCNQATNRMQRSTVPPVVPTGSQNTVDELRSIILDLALVGRNAVNWKDLVFAFESGLFQLATSPSRSSADRPSVKVLFEMLEASGLASKVQLDGLEEPLSLSDALAITRDWQSTDRRRTDLIEKKAAGELDPEKAPKEWAELQHLQNLAGIRRHLAAPLPIKELAEIEADLRRRGLWLDA